MTPILPSIANLADTHSPEMDPADIGTSAPFGAFLPLPREGATARSLIADAFDNTGPLGHGFGVVGNEFEKPVTGTAETDAPPEAGGLDEPVDAVERIVPSVSAGRQAVRSSVMVTHSVVEAPTPPTSRKTRSMGSVAMMPASKSVPPTIPSLKTQGPAELQALFQRLSAEVGSDIAVDVFVEDGELQIRILVPATDSEAVRELRERLSRLLSDLGVPRPYTLNIVMAPSGAHQEESR